MTSDRRPVVEALLREERDRRLYLESAVFHAGVDKLADLALHAMEQLRERLREASE